MINEIKLRKGLDIKLVGAACGSRVPVARSAVYAVKPEWFVGLTPKVVVKEGDVVKAGDAVFVDKSCPDVRCVAPVSGKVLSVERGERRKLLAVTIEASDEQAPSKPAASDSTLLAQLCESGLFALITQLPYAVVANPNDTPKAIFVSALRDMPLECPFEVELEGQESDWQAGLSALSTLAPTHLGIGKQQTNVAALTNARDINVTIYNGKCPAGNVGVQVNNTSPVNKGEVIWTVDPSVVIMIGRLLRTGAVDLTRTVAVAGSELSTPGFVDALIGTPLNDILAERVTLNDQQRIINGNPLTGAKSSANDFLGAHSSCVSVIPEGANANELLGWIMPRFNQFSTSRSYFSWLCPKKQYALDARVKGGERHMIMSGEYDRVLPMSIYGEYLIKAIISGNIDKQEALGIYEVSPEDFAVAEFVCSSKLPLQAIVRKGLDILRKENA